MTLAPDETKVGDGLLGLFLTFEGARSAAEQDVIYAVEVPE